jgi:hypothetical protein
LVGSGLTGTGISGYVPKWTGTKALDTSQIFQSNGLIGIGTNSPAMILDVRQNTSGDAISRIFNTNTSGTGKSVVRIGHNRTTLALANQLQFSDSLAFVGTVAADRTNGLTFFTGTTSSPTDNERMRINPSGNIAIGTTSDDGYRTNISGTLRTTGATWLGTTTRTVGIGTTTFTGGGASSFAQLLTSGSSGGLIINSDSGNINRIFFIRKNGIEDNEGLIRYNTGNFNMDFWTAALPRMTIFGNGRVGINTTTDAGYQFDLAGSMRNTTSAFFNTASGESYFGTTSDAGDFRIQVSGNARIQGATTITGVTKIGGDPNGQDAVGAVLGTVGTTHFLGSQTKGIARFYFGNNVTSDTLTQGVRLQMGATSSGSTNISGTPYIGSSIENVANAYQGLRFGIVGLGGVREAMRLTVEGAMGLNTPYEPAALLEVNTIGGTTGSTRMLRLSRNAQAGYGSTNFDQYYNSSSDYGLRIGNDATTWFGLNLFNGRVAINNGTTAGAYQLDVAGNIRSTTDAYFNTSSGESYFGTTSDAGNFRVQVNGVARASDGLATGAPNGGTAATWKLGIVVAGSYTAASNYLQVDVGGTLYYIGLVTPN